MRGEVDNLVSENHSLKVMLEKNEDNRQRQKEDQARIVAAIINLYEHVKKSYYKDKRQKKLVSKKIS